MIAVWLGVYEPFAKVSLIGFAATLFGGFPIFKEAFESLEERKMTMELSMSIALLAALAIGEYLTTLLIIFFVLIAAVLEDLTVGRRRRSIKNLLSFMPDQAIVLGGGAMKVVAVTGLQLGQCVVIKPGTRIPVDGSVVGGNSFVDQSTIAGESLPVEKRVGSLVYAGTMNQSGALEICATGFGENTAYGKIILAVERAERRRAPIQKTADRLARYLVYFALVAAGVT